MLADTAHQQQDERVTITSAQLVADTLEGIGVQALVGIAELRPEQTDAPRYLQPQHEQRYCGERTVNGVVSTQLYLVVNVYPLNNHEHCSRQDAWPYCVLPFDTRVGHQREKQHEDDNCKDNRRDMQDESHCLAKQLSVRQKGSERLQEDSQTTRNHHNKGEKQEDTKVVDDLPIDASRALHIPYRIEGLFDVCRKRK